MVLITDDLELRLKALCFEVPVKKLRQFLRWTKVFTTAAVAAAASATTATATAAKNQQEEKGTEEEKEIAGCLSTLEINGSN